MELQKNIWYITLLLSIVAGYCDTVTFVTADALFSAHVTGNFIVFAYQVFKGSDVHAWVKLLTFPVFILSVIVGGQITAGSVNRYILLFWEGLLLTLSGIAAYVYSFLGIFTTWSVYVIAMMVVFAMGLQNAFGKLYAKETLGPTTMMTGNVTQASLDLGSLLTPGLKNPEVMLSFKKQLVTITGFLTGCFLGAVAGKTWGLATIIIPGITMLFCYFLSKKQ